LFSLAHDLLSRYGGSIGVIALGVMLYYFITLTWDEEKKD
jgi:hypothetical protein